ncbi:hypothetical protein ABEB36_009182 [Hypothenemus hampei]|uniref:MADF domain-containing protein n=1 Tax=Hypothenemus hampei TaxID=57062 RepID=A0ABD1EPF9_HYPHA
MEWTQENALKLISLYENKQLLWKANNPHYFNKFKKQDAWEDIAREMGITNEECKKKMSSLLASLRRERTKMKKVRVQGKVGRDEIYESSWFAFNSMKFLWDKDIPKTRLNTIEDTEDIDNPNSQVSIVEEAMSDADLSNDLEPEKMPPPTTLASKNRKKQKIQDDRLDKAFKILETSTASSKQEDECDVFGKLVTKKLQTYSPLVRSHVQEEIMSIIFRADRGTYNFSSTSRPSFHNFSSENLYQQQPSFSANFQGYHHLGSPYPSHAQSTPISSEPSNVTESSLSGL